MGNGHAAYLLRVTNAYAAGAQAYRDGVPCNPPHYIEGVSDLHDPERRAWSRGYTQARRSDASDTDESPQDRSSASTPNEGAR